MNIPRFLSIGLFIAVVAIGFAFGIGWQKIAIYSAISFAGMIFSIFPSEAVEVIPYGTNDGRVIPEEAMQLIGIVAQVGCVLKLLFWL
jgi:hypothetical protein